MTDWRQYVRTQLPPLAVPAERESEIVDELALQLESAFDSAVAAGATDAEALRRAMAEVPDWTTLAAHLTRIERAPFVTRTVEADARTPWRGFVHDIARAVATLARAPAFSTVCIATLAVGLAVGLTALVVIGGVLYAPLPFASPDRLVLVHATVPPEGRDTQQHAFPDIADLAQSGAFSSLTALVAYSGTTTLVDPPIRVQGLSLTPNAFEMLGAAAVLGRTLIAADGRRGAAAVVVLGHGFWTRLGSPADIVGRTIVLDEVARTIVGIAAQEFRIDIFPDSADVFLPITEDFGPILQTRAVRAFRVLGRLADSVTIDRANAAIGLVGARLALAYPATNQGRQFTVRPLRDDLVFGVRNPLLLVGALVTVVVLIVAVNLGSLLLSRAVRRAREMSIRVALGASGWRLARQSFAESLVVAAVASVAGYVLARILLEAVRRAPGLTLPRLSELHISGGATLACVAFAAVVAATLTLLAHISPQRLQSLAALRTGHATADRRVSVIRGALVTGQTALAFVLLASALLLAVSLRSALSAPVGFDTSSVVTMRLMVPPTRYEARDATVQFYSDVVETLRGESGIDAAGIVSALPLDGGAGSSLTIAGKETVPEAMRPTIRWYWASGGYFQALGIPLMRGRDFNAADVTRAAHVTVINESLARLYFGDEDPIGRRVYYGPIPEGGVNDWHEIIGVVGDVHNRTIEEGALPAAFDLFGQHWGRSVSLAVRSTAGTPHVTSVVRRVIAQRDPRLAVFAVRTTSDLVANAAATRQLLLWLVAGFALVGLLVAILGLYGTVSYAVSARTREVGIRIAVGATARDIYRLVLAYGLRFAGTGILIGAIGVVAMRGLLENQLFGIAATDSAAFASAGVLLLAASLMACAGPARRAVGIDTVGALKAD